MKLRAGGLTAIERLRAERMCANNENVLCRQRSGCGETTVRKETKGDGLRTLGESLREAESSDRQMRRAQRRGSSGGQKAAKHGKDIKRDYSRRRMRGTCALIVCCANREPIN